MLEAQALNHSFQRLCIERRRQKVWAADLITHLCPEPVLFVTGHFVLRWDTTNAVHLLCGFASSMNTDEKDDHWKIVHYI